MKKKKDEITIRSSAAEYLTYVATVGDQQDSFEMRYEDENIWLTQKMMATLYDVDVRTINEHIKKIYSDSELGRRRGSSPCAENCAAVMSTLIFPALARRKTS